MAYTFKEYVKSKEVKDAEAKAAEYNTYNESQAVKDSRDKMTDYETNNKVAEWNGGTYGQAVNDAWNAINNREKFSYDLNGDALYQQYKDKYINQGRLAMADTIGQASAMTGGYGSSYAVTAGNQAYQSHLQNLNDIVPQLYQMAYDKYNQEGQDLKDKYSILNNMYQTEYGEHRDKVSDYNTELARLTDAYNTERAYDRSNFESDRTHYTTVADNLYNREFTAHNTNETNAFNAYQQSVNEELARAELKLQQDAATSGGGVDPLSSKEWAEVRTNALAIYGDNKNKDALINYLNGLVNRGYMSGEEAQALLDEIDPVTPTKKGSGNGNSSFMFTTGGGKFAVNTKN